jgi:hypothetical protein
MIVVVIVVILIALILAVSYIIIRRKGMNNHPLGGYGKREKV